MRSRRESDCLETWPAFEGELEAGEGVDADLIGTTERADGTVQATYGDWPLYYFAADAAGDIEGQGVNDVRYVVDAAGHAVEQAPEDSGGGSAYRGSRHLGCGRPATIMVRRSAADGEMVRPVLPTRDSESSHFRIRQGNSAYGGTEIDMYFVVTTKADNSSQTMSIMGEHVVDRELLEWGSGERLKRTRRKNRPRGRCTRGHCVSLPL